MAVILAAFAVLLVVILGRALAPREKTVPPATAQQFQSAILRHQQVSVRAAGRAAPARP